MKLTKGDIYFSLALILACWFTLTGMVWVYWAALIIGYPAGLLSLFLWYKGRKTDDKTNRYKLIPIVLLVGLLLSLGVLVALLITN